MKSKIILLLTLLSSFMATPCAFAATPVVLSPVPKQQFWNSNGTTPLSFGCVKTYISGTTTPLATYTDSTGNTVNTNPIILTAGGFAGSGSNSMWLQAGQAYRIEVKSAGGTNCASGTIQYTIDGIGGGLTIQTTVVTYSTTPSFPIVAQNQLFKITLTGNAVAQPLTAVGITPPGWIAFEITQDGAGGHSFTWPANLVGGATIGANANQVTTQFFYWNGSAAYALGPGITGNGPQVSVGDIYATGTAYIFGDITGLSDLDIIGTTTSGVFSSATANPATVGLMRLASADTVCWRNNANSGNFCLSKNASDNLVYAGGLSLGGGTALATTNQSGTGNLCLTTNCQLVTPALNGVTVNAPNPAAAKYCLTSTSTTAADWEVCLPAADFTVVTGTNGYLKLPAALGGLIFEWALGPLRGNSEGTDTVSLPLTCPTAVDNVQASYYKQNPGATADDAWYQINSFTTSQVVTFKQGTGGTLDDSKPFIFVVCH